MTQNKVALLKKGLQDPTLEGLTCIGPSEASQLVKVFNALPQDGCVSEWKYGVGEVTYRYHIHGGDTAAGLRRAFEEGIRGGHPTLTAVYTKKELQELISQYEADFEYQQDNQQIQH
jgi:hypothetical protein